MSILFYVFPQIVDPIPSWTPSDCTLCWLMESVMVKYRYAMFDHIARKGGHANADGVLPFSHAQNDSIPCFPVYRRVPSFSELPKGAGFGRAPSDLVGVVPHAVNALQAYRPCPFQLSGCPFLSDCGFKFFFVFHGNVLLYISDFRNRYAQFFALGMAYYISVG